MQAVISTRSSIVSKRSTRARLVGAEMVLRTFSHLLQYGELVIRRYERLTSPYLLTLVHHPSPSPLLLCCVEPCHWVSHFCACRTPSSMSSICSASFLMMSITRSPATLSLLLGSLALVCVGLHVSLAQRRQRAVFFIDRIVSLTTINLS